MHIMASDKHVKRQFKKKYTKIIVLIWEICETVIIILHMLASDKQFERQYQNRFL